MGHYMEFNREKHIKIPRSSPVEFCFTIMASLFLLAGCAHAAGRPPAGYTATFDSHEFVGTPRADPPVPPSKGSWETGVYRNLFTESGLHTQAEVDARIDLIYNQLFFGEPENQSVFVYTVSNRTEAYLWDVGDKDVRSEGMSYGMMVTVQLDKKEEFDALYAWAKKYMQHKDPNDARYGYFAWHCALDGSQKDKNPASDGETWIVTALYFASYRWGDDGRFNYKAEADNILLQAVTKESHGKIQDSIVDMFSPDQNQVVFTPYASAAKYTDPSYHLPAFYHVWAENCPTNKTFWLSLEEEAREYFQSTANAKTSLMPDYSDFTGAGYGSGKDFKFDAWRCAQNIGMDYAWLGDLAGDWPKTYANTLHAFFNSQNISSYGNQYSVDGQVRSHDHSPGLVAMNAVAAFAATESVAWQFVEALWQTPIPSGKWRYYDGMLYMLGYLQVSGKFRVWTNSSVIPVIIPTPVPAPTPPTPPVPTPPPTPPTPTPPAPPPTPATPTPSPPTPPPTPPSPSAAVEFGRNGRCLQYEDTLAAGAKLELGGCYIHKGQTNSEWMIDAATHVIKTVTGGLCVRLAKEACTLHTALVLGDCAAPNADTLQWDAATSQLHFSDACKSFCVGDHGQLDLEHCADQVTKGWESKPVAALIA